MIIQKLSFLWIFLFSAFAPLSALSLKDSFHQCGYAEICDEKHDAGAFTSLYASFDEFIEYLQTNLPWAQKFYIAKERFIRSKDRSYYSTDFFGFYDESEREGRHQVAFYYSIHFHEYIRVYYPEFNRIPEITNFLDACREIQKPYGDIFNDAAVALGAEAIFDSEFGHPPVLFKVIKYLPLYNAKKPHYDGSVFSLFLDSTDNQSLLLSPYQVAYTTNDFTSSTRSFSQHSILLIPGILLTDYSIYPTPHIVAQSGKIRYAAVAFAMRPNYNPPRTEFSILPSFTD